MLKIWFMYDNHTFARVKLGDRASLIAQAEKLFAEDGCGGLFARDEFDAGLAALNLNGRMLGKGQWGVTRKQIEDWADQVAIEADFRHRMSA